jgi:dsRNA-specific ribonuclease
LKKSEEVSIIKREIGNINEKEEKEELGVSKGVFPSKTSELVVSEVEYIESPFVMNSEDVDSDILEIEVVPEIIKNAMNIVESPSPDLFFEDYEKWYNSLRNYIVTVILPLFISKNDPKVGDYNEKLVDEISMSIWIKCFTHKSYDPDNNYEQLEFLGDSILKGNLASLMQAYGLGESLTEGQQSRIADNILSKQTQSRWGKFLGFGKWIRTVFPLNVSVHEDLFEAVFGTIHTLGEKRITPGIGYLLCQNGLVRLFDGIDLLEASTRDNITIIKEIFEMMG